MGSCDFKGKNIPGWACQEIRKEASGWSEQERVTGEGREGTGPDLRGTGAWGFGAALAGFHPEPPRSPTSGLRPDGV